MKVVRGRADARWLPSRHSSALFRLIAFLRLSTMKPEPANVTLVIDRNQSALESYAVATWYMLTTIAFITAVLPWSLPVAIAAAIPIAFIVIEIPLYVSGLAIAPIFVRDENRQRFNSAVFLILLLACAIYFARESSWVRIAAWQALAVAAINAVAAVLVFLLRGPMEKLEARVTCAP